MDAQQAAERFPNIAACAQGCTSGKWSEWPVLRTECGEVLSLLAAKDAEIGRLKATTREEIKRAISGTQGENRHSSVVSMLAGMTRDELNEAEADRDRLAAELARHHADAAETDASIRASAKRVLPAEKVDGDRTCVPPVEEVVQMLVADVAELRRDAERYRWLRERQGNEVWRELCLTIDDGPDDLDAAIDAALAAQK